MATSAHYPLSYLPWQGPNTDDEGFTTWYLCLVADARSHDALAIVYVDRSPAGWWSWDIYPCGPDLPKHVSSVSHHGSYTACERSLLLGLSAWLHGPPSRYLPPQEGATTGGKEADCA